MSDELDQLVRGKNLFIFTRKQFITRLNLSLLVTILEKKPGPIFDEKFALKNIVRQL
jgi:hypothetical protein